jgi:predicted DNA-binding transcriptional regulator AlpA
MSLETVEAAIVAEPQRLAFTIEQLCQSTGLCRDTIFIEMKTRRLRGRKIGKRRVFLVDDIKAWLDAAPEQKTARDGDRRPRAGDSPTA